MRCGELASTGSGARGRTSDGTQECGYTERQVAILRVSSSIHILRSEFAPAGTVCQRRSTRRLFRPVLFVCRRFVCTRQLKWVRKQFNEFETIRRTLLIFTLLLGSFAAIVVVLLADDRVAARRVALLCETMTRCPLASVPKQLSNISLIL